MSHNPPIPALLDILDRVGVFVMDENRDFANTTGDVHNMGDMVRRDRNHPSVVVWSFCNEAGCERAETGGPPFQAIAKAVDPSRNTLANMFTYGDLLSNTIDVQGFSHRNGGIYDAFHKAEPKKAVWGSECCSCMTMRGEDAVNKSASVRQTSFNAPCVQQQTNWTNGRDFVIGSMVWTAFDYLVSAPGVQCGAVRCVPVSLAAACAAAVRVAGAAATLRPPRSHSPVRPFPFLCFRAACSRPTPIWAGLRAG